MTSTEIFSSLLGVAWLALLWLLNMLNQRLTIQRGIIKAILERLETLETRI